MRTAWIAGLLLLNGCAALKTPETQAWLALHAVDTAQTFRIGSDPRCFHERDSLTQELIGKHPSDGEVLAWSAASAAIHLGVTEWLIRAEHPRAAKVWQYVRIGVTASAVADNHSIGIRIGSPNQPRRGSCDEESQPQTPEPRGQFRPIG